VQLSLLGAFALRNRDTVCALEWIPVVLQVNKLNEGYPDSIQKNFGFGWPVLGMLVPFCQSLPL